MQCSNQHETFKYLWFIVRDQLNLLKSNLLSDLLQNKHVILAEFGIVEEKDNVWYAKGMLKMCTKHPRDTFGRNIFRKFVKNVIYENITKNEYFKRLENPPIQQYRDQRNRRMKFKRKLSVSSASSISSDEENDIHVFKRFRISSPVHAVFLANQEKDIEVIDCF